MASNLRFWRFRAFLFIAELKRNHIQSLRNGMIFSYWIYAVVFHLIWLNHRRS